MKNVKHMFILSIPAGNAVPRPPISTTLGTAGVNMTQFCKDFNSLTNGLNGILEVGVMVYDDLSYDIVSKKELQKYQQSQLVESLGFLYKPEHQEEQSTKLR